jgi:hypothetical protein
MKAAAVLGTSTLLVLASACGRSGLAGRDAGPRDGPSSTVADVPGPVAPDGARERPSDPPGAVSTDAAPAGTPDLPVADTRPGDIAEAAPPPDLLPTDARPGDVATSDAGADGGTAFDLPPAGCPALANDGVLNLGRAKQARFAADGSSVLLRLGAADSDASDVAIVVRLADSAYRVLGSGIRNVEWLGQNAALLTAADHSKLGVVSLDGEVLLTVPVETCSHAAPPDGSRIYYTHSGCDSVSGALSVVTVADGTSKQLTDRAATGSLAVSPGSRFAAYVAYTDPRDMPPRTGAVFVNDASGATYNVTGPASAFSPVFVSESILLFQSAGSDGGASNIWRHDLGTGSSRALTQGDLGITGYEIAEDRSGLLMARFPGDGVHGELYLAPLDGGSPVRLATDIIDYRIYSMPLRPFTFAPPSGRVIYIADTSSDAGRTNGISSVAADGSDRVQLGSGGAQAVVSSYADRVAIIAVDSTEGGGTLSVVSAAGASQRSIEVAGRVLYPTFVPHDRGLLFVDERTGATKRLRHLSFASGNVTTLAEWTISRLALSAFPVGIGFGDYPVDPSGCVTVVDSDLDQTAARLAAVPE